VVPQRDVLHDALPLHVALWYTPNRLPTDMSSDDIVGGLTKCWPR